MKEYKSKNGYWFTQNDEDIIIDRLFVKELVTPEDLNMDNWIEVSNEWKEKWEMEHSQEDSVQDNSDIEELREKKIEEIEEYDKSEEVNSFTYNGINGWIDSPTRTAYSASIQNAELLGETSIDLLFSNTVLTLDIETAKVVLAKISRYADKCWMVTQKHLSEVKSFKTSKGITDFDVTKDYPEKLVF